MDRTVKQISDCNFTNRFMKMKNGHLGIVNKVLESLAALMILRELSREWPRFTYDLLSRNCNHFCDELCERLGVLKIPGWVNRFANVGDAAIEITDCVRRYLARCYGRLRLDLPEGRGLENCESASADEAGWVTALAYGTICLLKQDKTEIVSASMVAYRFLAGIATNSSSQPDSPNANRSSPRFQVSWFKNLLLAGDKPSTSSVLEEPDQELVRQQQQTQEDDGEPLLLRSINQHDA
ncbi:hypothetical protein Cgig2_007874 [Carnegiea gigantea]|uniref:PPPDE domain-containing protein n=1 Tax=Carnegiea gigantea TaxID=171969 RepID=A0A9Q1QHV0_9CARY|nr:hypothetical protein Cgig2_007874 [Carnegiea gigantea]